MSKFNAHLFWLVLIIIIAVVFIAIVSYFKGDMEKVPGYLWLILPTILFVSIISYGGR